MRAKNVVRALFNRGFCTLFLCYALACTCFAFVNVGMLLHATEDYGMDAVIVGSIIGIVSIVGLAMRPISAVVVDRINKKKILIFAFSLEALATLGFAFSGEYWMMYSLQILRGVAWGLISCAGAVSLVNLVGRDNLGVALGVYALGMVVGSSVAAAVVAPLGDAIGFSHAFVIAGCLSVVSALVALTLPLGKESVDINSSLVSVLGRIGSEIKTIRLKDLFSIECTPIMGISFAFQLCSTALGATYLVAFGRIDLGIANVGFAATVYNVIMYLSRPIYGRIMDIKGARWCVIPAFGGFACANLLVFFSTDMIGLYAAAAVYGLFAGGHSIAPRTMAIRRLGEGREAVASSTAGIGNDVGMFFGSMFVPAIATCFSGAYRNAYLVIALIACVGLIYALGYIYLYLKRHPDNRMGW